MCVMRHAQTIAAPGAITHVKWRDPRAPRERHPRGPSPPVRPYRDRRRHSRVLVSVEIGGQGQDVYRLAVATFLHRRRTSRPWGCIVARSS
jgi:hypothetical protein